VDSRESRKNDHIKYALSLSDGPVKTGFSDIHVMSNCLPEVDLDRVSLATNLPGVQTLTHPFIINAMTGGAASLETVNRQLAIVAKETGSAMAVGSQYGSVKSHNYSDSFRVVRLENPQGIIFANVSALATVSDGQCAVDMVEAQALQIHLNAAQELAMAEGDRKFSGYLRAIEKLCHSLSVPVIVKETGCGMAKGEIKALLNVGVKIIDIGGAGGTNFPAIEGARFKGANQELSTWGIPTAISLLEAVAVCGKQQGIVATGGIRTAMDTLKALILGANAVGMAGNILKNLTDGGVEYAVEELNKLKHNLQDFMVLTGCKTISQLKDVPVYYTGEVLSAKQCLENMR
jgi:isopentenyl-diphosphate delta-isomerase